VRRVLLLEARREDAQTIASLHAASWRATYRGVLPDSFLDDQAFENRLRLWRERMETVDAERVVIKAVDNGELCGFACVFLDADPRWGALLDNLHVSPALTGNGIGTVLLREALARVRAARPRSGLHLWVFEANLRARRFYERHGGTMVERKRAEVLPRIVVPEVRYAWTL
jgi:ribosomal protein S18 acetylase RimI-like enzyme